MAQGELNPPEPPPYLLPCTSLLKSQVSRYDFFLNKHHLNFKVGRNELGTDKISAVGKCYVTKTSRNQYIAWNKYRLYQI